MENDPETPTEILLSTPFGMTFAGIRYKETTIIYDPVMKKAVLDPDMAGMRFAYGQLANQNELLLANKAVFFVLSYLKRGIK